MDLVQIPSTLRSGANLIGGRWQASATGRTLSVASPWTGGDIGAVPDSDGRDVQAVVEAAQAAFPGWRATPVKERTQLMFRFRELLLRDLDELGNLAALESGKTVAEGKAGVLKGVEVVEFALSLQNLDQGAMLEVSRGVTCEVRREPLGVVAGITPFNFPAMVPMWLFPIAVTVGNCFVLKPSEKVPLTACRLGELMVEAGFPPGVFSVVHGGREVVEALIDDARVQAVGFVGSTPVARAVYARATGHGKRALALGGAKNHLLVVPDADPELTYPGVVSSFTGCAGQRCMAASLMVAVGDVQHLVDGIVEYARRVQLGRDMGAIIDGAARDRIESAIAQAERDGARVLLDGRGATPPDGYQGGHWLGPTIIDGASADMACARSEIFGPVVTIVRVPTLEAAMRLENAHPYGNATSVFTTSGAVARYVAEHATNGMIGVNVGVPVPREPFSFGGTKDSKFGQGDVTGRASLDLWTNLKKITTKWALQRDTNWMS